MTLEFWKTTLSIAIGVFAALVLFGLAVKVIEWINKIENPKKKMDPAEFNHAMPNPTHIPPTPYMSYRKYYDNTHGESYIRNFRSRAEAEDILDAMKDILNRYGIITVADFKDLIGEQATYINNKWGWKNLDDVYLVRAQFSGSKQYQLRLPRTIYLD